METPQQSRKRMQRSFWGTVLFMPVYLLGALVCLRQWNSAHPWSRLDIFSGGFLLLTLLWIAPSLRFNRVVFQSREVMREASGVSFDPHLFMWVSALPIAELTVFLDYGHWHILHALEIPALQWLGLAFNLLGALWLFWVDNYLGSHFVDTQSSQKIIDQGPFHWIRHPRYASLLCSRISFALALASILAWGFFVLWLILILRRIRLEEVHLRQLFGPAYDAYAARTARLLPGIF